MNTAAAETRRGTVWRKPSLLWTEQSTVSLDGGRKKKPRMWVWLWGDCSVSLSDLGWPPAGLALASGLAATVTITHMLKAGDGIVCMDDVYGGEAAPSEWVNDSKGVKKTQTTGNDFFLSFCFSTYKAQTATSKELLLRSAWMCHSLTAQCRRSWSPPWSPTPRWVRRGETRIATCRCSMAWLVTFPLSVCLLAQCKQRSGR